MNLRPEGQSPNAAFRTQPRAARLELAAAARGDAQIAELYAEAR